MSSSNALGFIVATFLVLAAQAANAENWTLIGADKDAMGSDRRTMEIDLDRIQRTPKDVSVRQRITSQSRGNVGYSCKEGDISHGNTDKKIAALICHKPTNPEALIPHEENWKVIRVHKSARGEDQMQIDLNSLRRIDDMAMVMTRQYLVTVSTAHYDCKGFYKTGDRWTTLDITDHIATVPRGFVSLERKAAEKVCSR